MSSLWISADLSTLQDNHASAIIAAMETPTHYEPLDSHTEGPKSFVTVWRDGKTGERRWYVKVYVGTSGHELKMAVTLALSAEDELKQK